MGAESAEQGFRLAHAVTLAWRLGLIGVAGMLHQLHTMERHRKEVETELGLLPAFLIGSPFISGSYSSVPSPRWRWCGVSCAWIMGALCSDLAAAIARRRRPSLIFPRRLDVSEVSDGGDDDDC